MVKICCVVIDKDLERHAPFLLVLYAFVLTYGTVQSEVMHIVVRLHLGLPHVPQTLSSTAPLLLLKESIVGWEASKIRISILN